jgi:hypothetical protein
VPNDAIKDEEQYKALRREGASKEKAARISGEIGIEGRSSMNKGQLFRALRNH